jgi:hypothetical protein
VRPPTDPIAEGHRPLRITVWFAAVFGVLLARTARADDPARFALSWTRAPDAARCISAHDLARRIEDRLGRAVFVPPTRAAVFIEGWVEPNGAGYHAIVSLTDAAGRVLGHRNLATADATCGDLSAPLVLSMALLIDPNAVLLPEGSAPRPAAAETKEPPPPRHPQPLEPLPAWHTAVEVGGAVGLGLLPGSALGLFLRVGVKPPRAVRVTLEGESWSEERLTPSASANPVGFSLSQAVASLCPLEGEGSILRGMLCGGAGAGVLSTHGSYDGAPRERHRFEASVLARAQVAAKMGSYLFLGVGLSASAPLVRDSFVYEDDAGRQRLFRMSAAAGIFELTLGFQSPR